MTKTDLLICPICRQPLFLQSGSLVCEKRHTYDVSKHGYVNLVNTSSKKESGDTKEMVRARTKFLDGGSYAPLREELVSLTRGSCVCVDAGCGEGYYSCAVGIECSYLLGFDLSRSAVEKAAKRARSGGVEEKCFFGVGSVYSMPVPDSSADCILSVFAPCAEEEFLRILKPGGKLVVACAGPRHLEQMKEVLYDTATENTTRADLPQRMTLCESKRLSYDITLEESEMIRALYYMTPYCYRTGIEAQKALLSLDRLVTRAEFDILVYKKGL